MAGWLSKDLPITEIYKIQPDEPLGALDLTKWTMLDGGSGMTTTPAMISLISRGEVPASPYARVYDTNPAKYSRAFRHTNVVPVTPLRNVRFSMTILQFSSVGDSYMQVCDATAGNYAAVPGLISMESVNPLRFNFNWNGVASGPTPNYTYGIDAAIDARLGIEILTDGFVRAYHYVSQSNIFEYEVSAVNMTALLPIGNPIPYTAPPVSTLGIAGRLGGVCVFKDLWIEVLELLPSLCRKSQNGFTPVWPMPTV